MFVPILCLIAYASEIPSHLEAKLHVLKLKDNNIHDLVNLHSGGWTEDALQNTQYKSALINDEVAYLHACMGAVLIHPKYGKNWSTQCICEHKNDGTDSIDNIEHGATDNASGAELFGQEGSPSRSCNVSTIPGNIHLDGEGEGGGIQPYAMSTLNTEKHPDKYT